MPRTGALPALKLDWTERDARKLELSLASLGVERALDYCQLAGFLFALACAPELVKPSSWLPRALGDELPARPGEANALLELVMALHNHINLQVLEGKPALPARIEVRVPALENFAPGASLRGWAGGFGAGQLFTEDLWNAYLPAGRAGKALDSELGSLNALLAFFMSREFAERCLAKMPGNPSLEVAAKRAVKELPAAMKSLAQLGRGLQ